MNRFDQGVATGMWRVIFYERVGNRVRLDRTGPWLPTRRLAQQWADWFLQRGYHVALQDQSGGLDRISNGLPS
ncbi:hypothetical protein [Roseateles violae]|uniref:Uncharacterized protein n=1 Tax=Roseateles violae TaxID=3058042 RepID=A0ABT8DLC2_9BURK|nr:hypothetical protein [Pelomonas sp. PFR6]MDN3919210.1 hypothetical protein [Pelomonas sp. PFR6]